MEASGRNATADQVQHPTQHEVEDLELKLAGMRVEGNSTMESNEAGLKA